MGCWTVNPTYNSKIQLRPQQLSQCRSVLHREESETVLKCLAYDSEANQSVTTLSTLSAWHDLGCAIAMHPKGMAGDEKKKEREGIIVPRDGHN